jgi:hypothetical protein
MGVGEMYLITVLLLGAGLGGAGDVEGRCGSCV